jgi:hypothetical protein
MALADLPFTRKQRRIFARRMQEGLLSFRRDVGFTVYYLNDVESRDEILYLFFVRWTHWAIARGSIGLFLAASIVRLMLGSVAGRCVFRAIERLKEMVRGYPSVRGPRMSRFHRAT